LRSYQTAGSGQQQTITVWCFPFYERAANVALSAGLEKLVATGITSKVQI
jgi:hypothetical protein